MVTGSLPRPPRRARWRRVLITVLAALGALLLPAGFAAASAGGSRDSRRGIRAGDRRGWSGFMGASPQVSVRSEGRRSCRSWRATVLPQKASPPRMCSIKSWARPRSISSTAWPRSPRGRAPPRGSWEGVVSTRSHLVRKTRCMPRTGAARESSIRAGRGAVVLYQ